MAFRQASRFVRILALDTETVHLTASGSTLFLRPLLC